MTQEKTILKHLKAHNFITPQTAYEVYGIFRLSARIYNLRNDHKITTEIMTGLNRFKKPCNYARYSLVK